MVGLDGMKVNERIGLTINKIRLSEITFSGGLLVDWRAMIARLLTLGLFLGSGLVTLAFGQGNARPDVPDAIKAPASDEVVLVAHATGAQIYNCQAGADGKFAWVLKAPDAELHDDNGKVVGHHFGGPTWQVVDGSQVKGKAVAKVDQKDAIPWLLVTVTEHSGNGKLSRVDAIQRINTKNGQAPASGCDASSQGKEVKSPYSADYYFYEPGK